MMRLAFIVSHPIQYYAPLHQRLAQRADVELKVFFTWHDGAAPVFDAGFGHDVRWDLPLTAGYDHTLVPNVSSRPGTSRFLGLRNPSLVREVLAWRPDAVHVTGWAWWSHLQAMRSLASAGVPVIFRGDSHLLDAPAAAWRTQAKQSLLRRAFRWPRLFLYTGQANRDYYRAFGVPDGKLRWCPHGTDVARFAQPAEVWEAQALQWRGELGLRPDDRVVLFAGKFEPKKRPVELLQRVLADTSHHVVMVGAGELDAQVRAIAATQPERCRVLPFQNQGRMPAVYRLGDVLVLPSSFGETWGFAVTEALACGRPAVVSDRVGCALDVAGPACAVFPSGDLSAMISSIDGLLARGDVPSLRRQATERAWQFDVSRTEATLVDALGEVLHES